MRLAEGLLASANGTGVPDGAAGCVCLGVVVILVLGALLRRDQGPRQ